jgi:hypothetical protein
MFDRERARRERQRQQSLRELERQREAGHPRVPPITVYKFREWCRMRGISVSTGRRLNAAGRIRFVHLSARCLGVRSDDDEAYLASCTPEA